MPTLLLRPNYDYSAARYIANFLTRQSSPRSVCLFTGGAKSLSPLAYSRWLDNEGKNFRKSRDNVGVKLYQGI